MLFGGVGFQSNYLDEKQSILGQTRGCRTINRPGVFTETQLTSVLENWRGFGEAEKDALTIKL